MTLKEEGKESFAFVDFGVNPSFSVPTASNLGNWIQAGMVSVGPGNNTWAGGDNKIAYGMTNYLPGRKHACRNFLKKDRTKLAVDASSKRIEPSWLWMLLRF